jgi:acyl-CoA synthetase (AMP-forming)/AMP-acid ligase II
MAGREECDDGLSGGRSGLSPPRGAGHGHSPAAHSAGSRWQNVDDLRRAQPHLGRACDRAGRLAAGLVALGVRPGERVAALAHASDRYFELIAATPWAGAVVVPLNWRWTLPELEFAILDCTPSLLFFDEAQCRDGAGAGRPAGNAPCRP